jgi:hypothetical protein
MLQLRLSFVAKVVIVVTVQGLSRVAVLCRLDVVTDDPRRPRQASVEELATVL